MKTNCSANSGNWGSMEMASARFVIGAALIDGYLVRVLMHHADQEMDGVFGGGFDVG